MTTEGLQDFAQQMLNNDGTAPNASSNSQPTTAPVGKTRQGEKFDLMKVDYAWVDNCTDKRELRLAYEALVEDRHFIDLQKYCCKRLKAVDKKFKSPEDFEKRDPVAEKAATEDVEKFFNEMNKNDQTLRSNAIDMEERSTSLFGGEKENVNKQNNAFVEAINLKATAEYERLKGNEFMKSKEYNEAITAYTKSIQIFPNEAATYSNRALAYLKIKKNGSCINDAEKCMELDPTFLKAYHRRGKAFQASAQYEEAIKDYQYILEKCPDDKDINKSLKDCRAELETRATRQAKEAEEKLKNPEGDGKKYVNQVDLKENTFKRVAIEEDSDDEEAEEETAADSTSSSFLDKKDQNYSQFTIRKSAEQDSKPKTGVHSTVYMDVKIANKASGRLIIDLFNETPKTAENFRCLCTGEKGIGKKSGKELNFKGSIFHRVIPGFMAQGGDFTNYNGTGGESIYGEKFADENFIKKHTARGMLSMANSGPGSNGSQFFLCFGATPHLDGRHVVFGQMRDSSRELLRQIEGLGSGSGTTQKRIEISACGQLHETAEEKEKVVSAETKNANILNSMIQEVVEPKKETKKGKKLSQEEKILNSLEKETKSVSDKLDKTKSSTDDIQRQIAELEEQRKALSEDREKISKVVEEATEKQKLAQSDYENTKKDFEKASAKVDKSHESMVEGFEKEGMDVQKMINNADNETEEVTIPETEEPAQASSSPTKSVKAEEEEEPRPVLQRVSSGILQNSDYKKKEKQRGKFDKIIAKIDSKKESAAGKFKEGKYQDAIKIYKDAAEILTDQIDSFPLWRKEIGNLEANVFNNIAFCYQKDQQDKHIVEYSSKVIDRALYIDDINILMKAYLRRGLAYEQREKYRLSANDLHRVREVQPTNRQAQTGLTRVLKYIEDDEGIKYIPAGGNDDDQTPLPEFPGVESPTEPEIKAPVSPPKKEQVSPVKEPIRPTKVAAKEVPTVESTPFKAEKEEEPVIEEVKSAIPEMTKQEEPKAEDKKDTAKKSDIDMKAFTDFDKKITDLKDRGNVQYKKKSYKDAIKVFSEAYNVYHQSDMDKSADHFEPLKTKVMQILTNRALAFHQINQQASVIVDTTIVLEQFDKLNQKALFRRAHAFRSQDKWEEASRDLQALFRTDPKNNEFKKDLDFCMGKLLEQQRAKKQAQSKKAEEASKAPKIQEVEEDPAKFKKVQITEEESSDSDDAAAAEAAIKAAADKKKRAVVDQATVEAAKAKASEQERANILSNLPKSVAALEKSFNALKKEDSAVVEFMKKIPTASIESLFKRTEIPIEILQGCLNAFKTQDVQGEKWVGDLMVTLTKADNFDMTVMFCEDGDKKLISEIANKQSKAIKNTISGAYGLDE